MIKRLICLFKGHNFNYNPEPYSEEVCGRCGKIRTTGGYR